MLKLFFVIVVLGLNSVLAQSPVDSLKIYDPFKNFEDVRRILLTYFSILGDENNALIKKYSEDIDIAKKNNSFRDEAEALLKSGDIFFKAGLYNYALDNYFKALKKYEGANDPMNAALVETKIGRTYFFADLRSSIDYIRKGYETIKNSDDFELRSYAAYIGGTIEKDEKKAKELFKKALDIQLEVIKNKPDDYEANENLSRFYNTYGNEEEALKIAEKIGDNWLVVLYLNNIGYKKVKEGKYNESVKYFFRSLDICLSKRYKTLLRNTYENIARAYQLMGKWEKSAFYYNLMHYVEESLFSEEFAIQASESIVKYESEKKESENEYLKKEQDVLTENIDLEKLQKYLLLLSFAGASFTSVYIYVSRKKIKTINKKLDEKNEKLAMVIDELQVNENNLKSAQEIAQIANWEWDLKNDVFTFSEQFPKIYDLDTSNLRTNFKAVMLEKIHPEDRELVNTNFSENNLQVNQENDYRIIKNDKVCWIKAKRVNVKDASGKVFKICGTVQDITELKEEEEIKIQIAAQMSFSKQLLESQEEERKRIAGELHDSLGQNLLVIKNLLLVKMQQSQIEGKSLLDTSELVSQTLQEVRSISHNLHPHLLDQLGLTKTIRSLTTQLNESTNISITAEIDDLNGTLEPAAEISLFRIIQECFNNIIKHSKAEKASLVIKRLPDFLKVSILDNGKGIDEKKINKHEEFGHGFGLYGMKKRAQLFDWIYEIDSHPGIGTEIKLTIPLKRDA
ncbi:MAG: ATP-binding protein [Ignavibacteriaceae bacterium]|nr:ATP-binding protein [Ignavibacteriaceae bacterium]